MPMPFVPQPMVIEPNLIEPIHFVPQSEMYELNKEQFSVPSDSNHSSDLNSTTPWWQNFQQ